MLFMTDLNTPFFLVLPLRQSKTRGGEDAGRYCKRNGVRSKAKEKIAYDFEEAVEAPELDLPFGCFPDLEGFFFLPDRKLEKSDVQKKETYLRSESSRWKRMRSEIVELAEVKLEV